VSNIKSAKSTSLGEMNDIFFFPKMSLFTRYESRKSGGPKLDFGNKLVMLTYWLFPSITSLTLYFQLIKNVFMSLQISVLKKLVGHLRAKNIEISGDCSIAYSLFSSFYCLIYLFLLHYDFLKCLYKLI